MRRRPIRLMLKRLMPSNLFARALLILVLPMLLSQLLLAHIFYDRHWSSVSRNMANSVVGDVSWLMETYKDEYRARGHEDALGRTTALADQLNITIAYDASRKKIRENERNNKRFLYLYRGLSERLNTPVNIHYDEEKRHVEVRMAVSDGTLTFGINRKQLTSGTTEIFMLWMVGSSLLLTAIATLFLRNQVRPIVQLARVAEQLGLGHEVSNFKPHGASEVRRAGRAFLVMAERIRRQVQNRTEMLAGISHDLRTPLTRMKLELELASMDAVSRGALGADIDEMGRMIDEYLDFARGDAGEIAEPIDLNNLLADIVRDYGRSKRAVRFTAGEPVVLMLRPMAMRRALTNLIDNGLRYGGGEVAITLDTSATFVRVKITDHGAGIPESELEAVFKPFTRLEPSRNSNTGGVGLGLSIARAVAQGHGGDVTLTNQRDSSGGVTGLEVTVRLPRAVQPTP